MQLGQIPIEPRRTRRVVRPFRIRIEFVGLLVRPNGIVELLALALRTPEFFVRLSAFAIEFVRGKSLFLKCVLLCIEVRDHRLPCRCRGRPIGGGIAGTRGIFVDRERLRLSRRQLRAGGSRRQHCCRFAVAFRFI